MLVQGHLRTLKYHSSCVILLFCETAYKACSYSFSFIRLQIQFGIRRHMAVKTHQRPSIMQTWRFLSMAFIILFATSSVFISMGK